jgi:hypothetical protein
LIFKFGKISDAWRSTTGFIQIPYLEKQHGFAYFLSGQTERFLKVQYAVTVVTVETEGNLQFWSSINNSSYDRSFKAALALVYSRCHRRLNCARPAHPGQQTFWHFG